MSQIAHHLPDELMLGYVSGRCSEGEALLAATHLTLCPHCRDEVSQLEEIAGGLLSLQQPSSLAPSLLPRTIQRIEALPISPEVAQHCASDGVLPRPLLRYTGRLDEISWQSRLMGALRYVELPIKTQGVPVRLQRIRRRSIVPRHLHAEPELELYLAGGAIDTGNGKHYARGDVSLYDRGEPHQLSVDPEEDCILLCVHRAPLLPVNLLGRIVYGALGLS